MGLFLKAFFPIELIVTGRLTVSRPHDSKHESEIETIDAGISIVFKDLQLKKADVPICVILSVSFTEDSERQFLNALLPMVTILPGKSTDKSAEHPEKALSEITCGPFEISTLNRAEQFKKVSDGTVPTPDGIFAESSFSQPLNT